MTEPTQLSEANGNSAVFDAEWRAALETGDRRWLSFPARHPHNQTELFEWVKATQVDVILDAHQISGGRVLEYGCGSAGMAAYLALRGFQATALDLSLSAIELARRNARLHQVPAETLHGSLGDVFALPFADESFDVVMSYGLLEHFTPEQLRALLQETARVVRPGGIHLVDIIHGRPSSRTLGTLINFTGSAAARLLRGQASQLGALYRAYFEHYYENTLGPAEWAGCFRASGLEQVQALVCRPFPPLAIGGPAERAYIRLLQALLPLWRWFDRTDLPLIKRLGWMYLVYGSKPAR